VRDESCDAKKTFRVRLANHGKVTVDLGIKALSMLLKKNETPLRA
jgi:hypothetical protein